MALLYGVRNKFFCIQAPEQQKSPIFVQQHEKIYKSATKKSEYPEGYSDGPSRIIGLEILRKENQIEAQRSGFDLERSRDRMNER